MPCQKHFRFHNVGIAVLLIVLDIVLGCLDVPAVAEETGNPQVANRQIIPIASESATISSDDQSAVRYFVVDLGLRETRWVVDAEVLPGTPEVIQQATVYLRTPRGSEGSGWFAAYTRNTSKLEYPPGAARRVPRGSQLVFRIHYHSKLNETATDLTRVALQFAAEDSIDTEIQIQPIKHAAVSSAEPSSHALVMPPEALPQDSRLWAIAATNRAAPIKVFTDAAPGATESTELAAWQKLTEAGPHWKILPEPLALGSQTIRCVLKQQSMGSSTTDSAEANKPSAIEAEFDDGTAGYLALLVARQPSKKMELRQRRSILPQRHSKQRLTIEQREIQAKQITDNFFQQLDGNQDGRITRRETTATFRTFAWRIFDTNDDDELSWNEVLQQARLSLRP